MVPIRIFILGMLAVGLHPVTAEAAPAACGGMVLTVDQRKVIYAEERFATCPWAFTTGKIMVGCEGPGEAGSLFAMTEDEKLFALNGLAQMRMKLPALDSIWKNRADIPGAKTDVTPWMDAARTLCR